MNCVIRIFKGSSDIILDDIQIESSVMGKLYSIPNCNPITTGGKTVLHLACEKRDLNAVENVLKCGADCNTVTTNGKTALHIACEMRTFSIVKILLKRGSNYKSVTIDGKTALHFACEKVACENGISFPIVEILLKCGADCNAATTDGKTALHFACETRAFSIVKLLLNCGADCNAATRDGKTALHFACETEGSFFVVKFLLDSGANCKAVTHDGKNALHFACETKRSLPIVEILLKSGTDCKAVTTNGRTALHIASQMRSYDISVVLLNNGADVSATEKIGGKTPLAYAYYSCSSAIIQLLAKHILKIQALDLFVSESDVHCLKSDKLSSLELEHFKERCSAEVKCMKGKMICKSNINFFDILTQDENNLADYMLNDKVEQVGKLGSYMTEFPIYANLIRLRFIQGVERRDLLKKSADALYSVLVEFYAIPYVCVQRIVQLLPNKDLTPMTMNPDSY